MIRKQQCNGIPAWMADRDMPLCRGSVNCLFFELWKSNHLPAGTAVSFFVIRTINKRDLKLYGEQIILGYL